MSAVMSSCPEAISADIVHATSKQWTHDTYLVSDGSVKFRLKLPTGSESITRIYGHSPILWGIGFKLYVCAYTKTRSCQHDNFFRMEMGIE